MHISSLKQSKFLTRADVGTGVLLTIKEVYQDTIANYEGEETVWFIRFEQAQKPMVLKPVNGQLIAQALKSEESDDWIGKQIVLYDEPNVTMKGKVVGGIRARAPKGAKAPAPAPAARPAPKPEPPVEDDSEMPF